MREDALPLVFTVRNPSRVMYVSIVKEMEPELVAAATCHTF